MAAPGWRAASTPSVVRVTQRSSQGSVAVTLAERGPSSTRATSPKKSPAERLASSISPLPRFHGDADASAQYDVHAMADVAGADDALAGGIGLDGALLE